MAERIIHVLGARGLVGRALLRRLAGEGSAVVAHSRSPEQAEDGPVRWRRTGEVVSGDPATSDWICLLPIWALPEFFPVMERAGARRVVAVSSTSRFSKKASSDAHERVVAESIAECEAALEAWASARGIEWVVLRPTLIYGNGDDANICEIARLVARFGFFPLIGAARGRRQPVHADDVAGACAAALTAGAAANTAYTLSGAEVLTYREMVERIFAALSRRPRFVVCPIWVFRAAIAVLRIVPRYRNWSIAMVERMNQDMVFDHDAAARDLGFAPRRFEIGDEDLPR